MTDAGNNPSAKPKHNINPRNAKGGPQRHLVLEYGTWQEAGRNVYKQKSSQN